MKFIRTSKFVKADPELIYKLREALIPHFLKKFSMNDEMQSALDEERYEDAARIRDEHTLQAEDMATRLSEDISEECDKMGIPFRFENIMANGIAMNDFCVISNRVLDMQPHMMMFVIFHELAHHYQYQKHGHDFAESIYTNDISKIQEDVERLVWIEDTADKFGEMKANFYIRKYDLGNTLKITARKKNPRYYLQHILRMKEMVSNMPPEKRNIRDINEALYNSIKQGE